MGTLPPLRWGEVWAGSEDLKSHLGPWCPATEVPCFCSPNYFLESIVGVTHGGAAVGSCGASTCDLSSRLTAVASLSISHSLEPESQEGDVRSPSPPEDPWLLLALWLPASVHTSFQRLSPVPDSLASASCNSSVLSTSASHTSGYGGSETIKWKISEINHS